MPAVWSVKRAGGRHGRSRSALRQQGHGHDLKAAAVRKHGLMGLARRAPAGRPQAKPLFIGDGPVRLVREIEVQLDNVLRCGAGLLENGLEIAEDKRLSARPCRPDSRRCPAVCRGCRTSPEGRAGSPRSAPDCDAAPPACCRRHEPSGAGLMQHRVGVVQAARSRFRQCYRLAEKQVRLRGKRPTFLPAAKDMSPAPA